MNKKDIKRLQTKWFETNAPSGRLFGYPECCIRAFGNDPPEVMQRTMPTKEHLQRYAAACINGKFTGFIPCYEHAKQILSGKITLESLINNRLDSLPPFPNV